MHWPGVGRWLMGLLAVLAVASVAAGCGSDSKKGASTAAKAPATQTIRFQKPEDPGPMPFTDPADVSGSKTVSLKGSGSDGGTGSASGPYGGTGSDKVCDRDLLIRFLRDNPERMRAWAEVRGIDPSYRSVSRYIAKLHPVTLTRDTQVTNHSFVNGHATAFQSILAAGTAVLVDRYGHPVARKGAPLGARARGGAAPGDRVLDEGRLLHPRDVRPLPRVHSERDGGADRAGGAGSE
jgi:hypothetical protein